MRTAPLQANWITPEAFHPYGQVIFASPDGQSYGEQDAQLKIDQGIPRFYIMRLHAHGRTFSRITRHQRCTQCLGALEGHEWLMAVAAPSISRPALDNIQAFRIPGNCFIKLNLGTWHAGPYFDQETIDFYNLELSDTNVNDHDTYDFGAAEGIEFTLVTP